MNSYRRSFPFFPVSPFALAALMAAALVGFTLLLSSVLMISSARPAAAQQDSTQQEQAQQDPAQQESGPLIVVAEVNGLIDRVTDSYLREQIALAVTANATALVLQLDSGGTTLSSDDLVELLAELEQAELPIGVWVGPSGATARGGSAHLIGAATFTALAPSSTIGQWSDLSPASPAPASPALADTVPIDTVLTDNEAVSAEVVDTVSPTIGDFLLALSDAEIIDPIASEVTNDDGRVQRTLSEEVSVEFVQPSLLDSLFHTAASPAIAYLLLLVGLSMVVLDFFTGGIGVAAAVGLGSMALSAYGLGELDIRIWALVALIGAFAAFAIDLQASLPRFWTAAGSVLLVVGSLFLFGRHSLNWLPFITGVVLVAVFMYFGMPSLIRTRYGTAAVDRQWLIGAVGVVVTDINPEGVLEIDSARWSARAASGATAAGSSAAPPAGLRKGEQAIVTGLSGVILEVEPRP